jgi:hypothetical protein
MSLIKLAPYIIDSTLDFTFHNVTATGNLVSSNANLGNLAIANYFSGSGNNLSNIQGANVSGTVSLATSATTAGTVTTAAQPNITSTGTLTSLSVSGGLTVGGNLTVNGTLTSINSTIVEIDDLAIVLANDASTSSQANGAGIIINGASANMLYVSTSNAFVFSHKISADGSLLSNLTGANVTGAVSYATTANAVAGANVSGAVSYATTANSVAVANVSGIGNIATINKDGNASNILYGNGVFASAPVTYGNSNVATFLASFGSNTLTTTGNITAGNANLGNSVTANFFTGNGHYLTDILGTQITGEVAYANRANSVAVANVSGIGNIATINKDGNASNVLFGNGVFAAAPSGGGSSYGNSNVATYLPTYTGDLSPGNITIGVSNLKISGGTADYVLKTDGAGNLSWTAQSGSSSAPLVVKVDSFTADGSGNTYTITNTPASKDFISVLIDGVTQMHTSFNVTGNVVTLLGTPVSSAKIDITTYGGDAVAPVGSISSGKSIALALVFGF